jgi:hypothetical protein
MLELYIGMAAITAVFVWTRSPPHKDGFALVMLALSSVLWPVLLVCVGYLIWEESRRPQSISED